MGLGCSCYGFGQLSPQRLPKKDANDQNVGLLTIPKTEVMKRKNELPPQEKQQQQLEKAKEFTTLMDCLLASPALNGYSTSSGDDQKQRHVLKQNKIYPAMAEDSADYAYNSRGSFSTQRLLLVGEVDSCSIEEHIPSSFRRGRSKKTKKRVSFKLPEEADIFVYSIPEDDE